MGPGPPIGHVEAGPAVETCACSQGLFFFFFVYPFLLRQLDSLTKFELTPEMREELKELVAKVPPPAPNTHTHTQPCTPPDHHAGSTKTVGRSPCRKTEASLRQSRRFCPP